MNVSPSFAKHLVLCDGISDTTETMLGFIRLFGSICSSHRDLQYEYYTVSDRLQPLQTHLMCLQNTELAVPKEGKSHAQ
jgi:hypothetical protein